MKWQTLLTQLKLEYIKTSTPGFFKQSGGYTMRLKLYNDTTANGLTTAIVDFINYVGGEASRISSTGTPRVINGQIRWTKSNMRKGIADIRGTYQGRSLSIEVKIGKDRLSEAQEQEMIRITKAGGLAFVVNDFPQFLIWFVDNFPEVKDKLLQSNPKWKDASLANKSILPFNFT